MVTTVVIVGQVKTRQPQIQVEIYNRLGIAPVPKKDLQYWRNIGIVLA